MKTIRRLAILAVFNMFAAAGTAVAQMTPINPLDNPPVPVNPSDNLPPSGSKVFTADDLADVLPAWFKGTNVEGKGDARTFNIPPLPHTVEGGKDTMSWSVFLRLHKRTDRPAAVRIFFPCKAVPADAHPERLSDLLGMSGAIQDSPAYFIVTGSGKDRMLTLVTEMSAKGLDRGNLETEINGLFRAAERTSNLWGGDLSKPPATKEAKHPLTGHRSILDARYNAGSAPPPPFVAGLNYLYLADDGTVSAGVQEGEKSDGKGIISRKGTYLLKGDELSLVFGDRKTSDSYKIKVKDGKLTLTPNKENTAGVTDLEITLNKW